MSSKTVLVDGGSPVALDGGEGARFIYNLLPVGKFYDKRYGELFVNDRMLAQMERNFGTYPAYEVPVKIGHDDGAPSPGTVIGVQATNEGLEITMAVDHDTAAAILKKQYRYMSAEFDEHYMDKETGEDVGAVLLGAALVNQPANPYMEPLVLADDIGGVERPLTPRPPLPQGERGRMRGELLDTNLGSDRRNGDMADKFETNDGNTEASERA